MTVAADVMKALPTAVRSAPHFRDEIAERLALARTADVRELVRTSCQWIRSWPFRARNAFEVPGQAVRMAAVTQFMKSDEQEARMLYTSGDWFVKSGREEEFINAWRDLAEWTAAEFAPKARAMLLRDRDESSRFRSFGPGRATSRLPRGGKAKASCRGSTAFARWWSDSTRVRSTSSATSARRCPEPRRREQRLGSSPSATSLRLRRNDRPLIPTIDLQVLDGLVIGLSAPKSRVQSCRDSLVLVDESPRVQFR